MGILFQLAKLEGHNKELSRELHRTRKELVNDQKAKKDEQVKRKLSDMGVASPEPTGMSKVSKHRSIMHCTEIKLTLTEIKLTLTVSV